MSSRAAAAIVVLAASGAALLYARSLASSRTAASDGAELVPEELDSPFVQEPPGSAPYVPEDVVSDLVTEPPPEETTTGADDVAAAVLGAVNDVTTLVGFRFFPDTRWLKEASKPENQKFVATALDAERRYNMPTMMLVRQIWQESRFNPNAFNKGSGASGIMQIVPSAHPYVDVWDPIASINYGAQYDAELFGKFGSWDLALKGYNAGPNRLAKFLAGTGPALRAETLAYSKQILEDIAKVRTA